MTGRPKPATASVISRARVDWPDAVIPSIATRVGCPRLPWQRIAAIRPTVAARSGMVTPTARVTASALRGLGRTPDPHQGDDVLGRSHDPGEERSELGVAGGRLVESHCVYGVFEIIRVHPEE